MLFENTQIKIGFSSEAISQSNLMQLKITLYFFNSTSAIIRDVDFSVLENINYKVECIGSKLPNELMP